MSEAKTVRWADLQPDSPLPLIERRILRGEHATIGHMTLHKGLVVPEHHHPSEQFACVQSGLVRFTVGAAGTAAHRTVEVGAGEVLHLPSNVPHSATALETSIVLDVFTPPAEQMGVDMHARK